MASRTDGGNVEARPDEARPGVTVTDPRFPTTLVHVRDSLAQMAEVMPELVQPYLNDELEARRTVRVTTPVRVRGRVVHRGGDVTYALRPSGESYPDRPVQTWSARSGSPVVVPWRQLAWLG